MEPFVFFFAFAVTSLRGMESMERIIMQSRLNVNVLGQRRWRVSLRASKDKRRGEESDGLLLSCGPYAALQPIRRGGGGVQ